MDIDEHILQEGDRVMALRYDLEECELTLKESGYVYRSVHSGKEVSWLKMIDASTERQKVRKIPVTK